MSPLMNNTQSATKLLRQWGNFVETKNNPDSSPDVLYEGGGGERASFSPFELGKLSERPLGQRLSLILPPIGGKRQNDKKGEKRLRMWSLGGGHDVVFFRLFY